MDVSIVEQEALDKTLAAASEQQQTTRACAKPGCPNDGNKLCGACGQVAYCSAECQREDWKSHKTSCMKKPTEPLVSFSDAWTKTNDLMKQAEAEIAANDTQKAIKTLKQALIHAEHQFGEPVSGKLRRERPDGDSISSWEVDTMLLTIATRLGDLQKDIDTPDALRAADGYYQKARKAINPWCELFYARTEDDKPCVNFENSQLNLIMGHLSRTELNLAEVALMRGHYESAGNHGMYALAFARQMVRTYPDDSLDGVTIPRSDTKKKFEESAPSDENFGHVLLGENWRMNDWLVDSLIFVIDRLQNSDDEEKADSLPDCYEILYEHMLKVFGVYNSKVQKTVNLLIQALVNVGDADRAEQYARANYRYLTDFDESGLEKDSKEVVAATRVLAETLVAKYVADVDNLIENFEAIAAKDTTGNNEQKDQKDQKGRKDNKPTGKGNNKGTPSKGKPDTASSPAAATTTAADAEQAQKKREANQALLRESEKLSQRALRAMQKNHGPGEECMGPYYLTCAEVLLAQSKVDRTTRQLLERYLAIALRYEEEGGPMTLRAYEKLGTFYMIYASTLPASGSSSSSSGSGGSCSSNSGEAGEVEVTNSAIGASVATSRNNEFKRARSFFDEAYQVCVKMFGVNHHNSRLCKDRVEDASSFIV